MAKTKHGRCKRGIRPRMGSQGRPGVEFRHTLVEFWSEIGRGASSESAANTVGVSMAVAARWFRQGGGMRPLELVPLSGRYLSLAEREQIALLRAQGSGVREIARQIDRNASTISRELCRNAATRSGYVDYRATTAQWHAERRGTRPKAAKLATNEALRDYVQERLAGAITSHFGRHDGPAVKAWNGRRHGRRQDRRWGLAWSPQQIANRLRIDFPDDIAMRISHEAIYQALYIRSRHGLSREFTACLRTGRALRMPRARGQGRGKQFVTPDVLITQRPANADDRQAAGHWEGDLILGLGSSAIGTLVERASRYAMLLHLPRMPGHGGARDKRSPALAGHGAEAVRNAVCAALRRLPRPLRQTLTWDQGAEMAQHVKLREDLGTTVYFCEPRSPWQRGTNENFNGLLRQYFPKGTDLCRHDISNVAAVQDALNARPRKILGWQTPAEVFNKLIAESTSSPMRSWPTAEVK
jgi:IS30 family transposase